jgi:phosphoribosyl-ATP pyrophosphohydrolase
MYVSQLAIAKPSAVQRRAIEEQVEKILAAKKKYPAADTSQLEREIDEIVYKLYGLTEEEIKIVEGK